MRRVASAAMALAALLAGGAAPAEPPGPLRCLARHYRLAAEQHDGAWFARLPDGRLVSYDDGRSKTPEQRLEAPDLEDMFASPYRAGEVRPVTNESEDPGRARVDAIFAATYGASPEELDLQSVSFLGARLRVHRKVTEALARVEEGLRRAAAVDPRVLPYLQRPGGGYAWRAIAGTTRRSAHAYGIAVDLDPSRCQYWRWQAGGGPPRWENRVPQAVVDAFEGEGFIWGGRWYHYDTMHFEYRPELLDPECAPRPPSGASPAGSRSRRTGAGSAAGTSIRG